MLLPLLRAFFCCALVLYFSSSFGQQLLDAEELDIVYNDVETDANGNIIAVGRANLSGRDADPGVGYMPLSLYGSTDCSISKLDSNYNVLWAHSFGSDAFDEAFEVALDGSGNIFVCGQFRDTLDADPTAGVDLFYSNGGADFFLSKYDAAGNYQWCITGGGSGTDNAFDVAADNSGNVYITGQYSQGADFDPSVATANIAPNSDDGWFVAKYSSAGSLVWLGGAESGLDAYGTSIACDGSSYIHVAGRFSSTCDFDFGSGTHNLTASVHVDPFVAKYSLSGSLQWAHVINGGHSEGINEMVVDGSGNAYVAGTIFPSSGTMDLNPGAGTNNVTPVGGYGIWLVKFSPSGNHNWGFLIGSTLNEFITDLLIDDNNNVVVAGNYAGKMDVDPGSGVYWLEAPTSALSHGMLLSYSPAGNFNWAISHGKNSLNFWNNLALDHNNNLLTQGWYSDSTDLDPGAAEYLLQDTYGEDFLARFDPAHVDLCPGSDLLWTTHIQDTSARLNWNILPHANAYKIRYVVAGSGGAPTSVTKFWNHGTRTITGLTPGTTYNWSVQTKCGSNWGGFSDIGTFTTLGGVCSTPDSLATDPIGTTQARINWAIPGMAYEHRIQYRLQGTSSWTHITKDGTWDKHWLIGLQAGSTYEWRIRTACQPGNTALTPWSAIQVFTTTTSNKDALASGSKVDADIAIWPNPATTNLNISMGAHTAGSVYLFDSVGKLALSKRLSSDHTLLSLSDLPRGVYTLQLIAAKQIHTQRVVLQ